MNKISILDWWELWLFLLLLNGSFILIQWYYISVGKDLIVWIPLNIFQVVAFILALIMLYKIIINLEC